MSKKAETWDGIDQLRFAVRLFDNCNETFNQQFTVEELLTLWRMYRACGWDVTPDTWAPRQIQEALERNVVPRFREDNASARDGIAAVYADDATERSTYRLTTDDDETVVTAREFFDDNAADDDLMSAILALDVGECHEEAEWSLTRVT